ncbi:FAD-binding oxidoreductase [soil metagenome]
MTSELPLDELRALVAGPVFSSFDPDLAAEVTGADLSAVHRPDVTVGVATEADVVEAVRFAATHDLPIRILSTGHGTHDSVTSGMLITTKRLDSVQIDFDTGIATIGAGARWSAVMTAIEAHGESSFTAVTGSAPSVGAVGYVLGGGYGPLIRSHGVSSDYVLGFTVVTADGVLREVDAQTEADLYWALRGGKGGLGVVTSMRFQLVSIPELYAGSLWFDAPQIESVMRSWVEWTETAPRELSTSVAIMTLPPLPFIPEPLRGHHVISLRFAYPGPLEKGKQLASTLRGLGPVLLDALGPLPATKTGLIHGDPTDPAYAWTHGFLLTSIDQDLASAALGITESPIPLVALEVRHLGGAAATDVDRGSAVGGRSAGFALMTIGVPDPGLFAEVLPAVDIRIDSELGPWRSPETTINWTENGTDAEYRSAWPAKTFERLTELRGRYDPEGIFAYGPLAG